MGSRRTPEEWREELRKIKTYAVNKQVGYSGAARALGHTTGTWNGAMVKHGIKWADLEVLPETPQGLTPTGRIPKKYKKSVAPTLETLVVPVDSEVHAVGSGKVILVVCPAREVAEILR